MDFKLVDVIFSVLLEVCSVSITWCVRNLLTISIITEIAFFYAFQLLIEISQKKTILNSEVGET